MTVLTLTPAQVAILQALTVPTRQAYEEGISAPGGSPSSFPGFKGFDKLPEASKVQSVEGLKQALAPLLAALAVASTTIVYAPVTYATGWSAWPDSAFSGGGVRVFKDLLGFVHVEGLVKAPSAGAGAYTQCITLPEGYRPLTVHIFPCVHNDVVPMGMYVYASGGLLTTGAATANGWISMNFIFPGA